MECDIGKIAPPNRFEAQPLGVVPGTEPYLSLIGRHLALLEIPE